MHLLYKVLAGLKGCLRERQAIPGRGIMRQLCKTYAGLQFAPGRTGKVRVNVDPIAGFRPGQTGAAELAARNIVAGSIGFASTCKRYMFAEAAYLVLHVHNMKQNIWYLSSEALSA